MIVHMPFSHHMGMPKWQAGRCKQQAPGACARKANSQANASTPMDARTLKALSAGVDGMPATPLLPAPSAAAGQRDAPCKRSLVANPLRQPAIQRAA